jgi:hypothetical protein
MTKRIIYVYVSAGQRGCITAAADAAGMTVSGWVRHQALSAAPGAPPLPAPLPTPRPRRFPAKRPRRAITNLTEEQFATLVEHAHAHELTVSSFIREVLFDGKPLARRLYFRSAIVAIHRAGNHLNHALQLAGGALLAPDVLGAVTALQREIHELRDALLAADAAAALEPSD